MPSVPGGVLLLHPTPIRRGVFRIRGDFLWKGLGIGQSGLDLGWSDIKIPRELFGAQAIPNGLRHPLNGEPCALEIRDTARHRLT